MKKSYFIFLGLLVIIVVLLVSCVKEFVEQVERKKKPADITRELDLTDAQLYFEGFITDFQLRTDRSSTNADTRSPLWRRRNISPTWSKGHSFTFFGVPTVEIPLNTGDIHVRELNPQDTLSYTQNKDLQYPNAFYRLVGQKDSEGDILFFVALIQPDELYLAQKKVKLSKITLKDLGEFSGQIKYYKTNGDLIGGHIFRKGARVGLIKGREFMPDTYLPGPKKMTTRGWEMVEECFPDISVTEECETETEMGWEDDIIVNWVCHEVIEEIETCYEVPIWIDDETEEPEPDPDPEPNEDTYCDYGIHNLTQGQECDCCEVCQGPCKCPNHMCHQSPCSCCPVCKQPCLCPRFHCHSNPCVCKQCEEITKALGLLNNVLYTFSNLANNPNVTWESMVAFSDNWLGTYDMQSQSAEGSEIQINLIPSQKLSGLVHHHRKGDLPNFSATDMCSIYEIYQQGLIKDTYDFAYGVVTSDGVYFLKIENTTQLESWGANVDLNKLEILYRIYNPTTGENMAKFLSDIDSGLSLMKYNIQSGKMINYNWDKSQGQVRISDC